MSLLMDALKKAEQEKQKLAQQDASASGQFVAGAAREAVEGGEINIAAPESTAPSTSVSDPQSDTPAARTSELSLEPLDSGAEDDDGPIPAETLEALGQTQPSGRHPGEHLVRGHTGEFQLEGDASSTGNFDHDSTLPSERAIQTSLEEYFSASQSMSMERRVSDLSISGQRMVEPAAIDEALGTHVSAHTVFEAGTGAAATKTISLITRGLIVGVACLGAAALYYTFKTPSPVEIKSPLAARGLETEPNVGFTMPEIRPRDQTVTVATTVTGTTGTVVAGDPSTADPVTDLLGTDPDEVQFDSTAPSVAPGPATVVAAAPSVPASLPRVTQPTSNISSLGATPTSLSVNPAAIKITKSRSQERAAVAVVSGYNHFQSGDMNTAADLYNRTLAEEPNNRDALLGLAAIAMQAGNLEDAFERYLEVVRLYPRDSVASAALFSLQRYQGPNIDESHLKLMLDSEPNSPHLLFSLGNYYAKNDRWAQAQQAFFDAYVLEKANPDYAFNLAVSLERLGKSDTALDYYQKALAAADTRVPRFNPTIALARIQNLARASSSVQ